MVATPSKPKVSYNHGYLTDCDDASDWTNYSANNIDPEEHSLTVESNDFFKIEATVSGVLNEYVYYYYNLPVSISASTYPHYVIRWKTSKAADGLGARIKVLFDGGGSEWLLGGTTPEFSTLLKVTKGTISDQTKSISQIQLWADDYPDGAASDGTHQVYFDFVLLSDYFEFPNARYSRRLDLQPKRPFLEPPFRSGDIQQTMGTKSTIFACSCDLDKGKLSTTDATNVYNDWLRPQGDDDKTDVFEGQVFFDIMHKCATEPWQWLETGLGPQFKATLEECPLHDTGEANRIIDLVFKEYTEKRSVKDDTFAERYGLVT